MLPRQKTNVPAIEKPVTGVTTKSIVVTKTSIAVESLNFPMPTGKIGKMNIKPEKTYTLTGADGKTYDSETKGKFGGHRKDKIYGTLDCQGASRWIAKGHYVKQRVFFADEQTAIAAGYRPCYECLRGKYKEWKEKKILATDVHR